MWTCMSILLRQSIKDMYMPGQPKARLPRARLDPASPWPSDRVALATAAVTPEDAMTKMCPPFLCSRRVHPKQCSSGTLRTHGCRKEKFNLRWTARPFTCLVGRLRLLETAVRVGFRDTL